MTRFLPVLLLTVLFLSPLRAEEGYHWFHHIQAAPDDVRAICPAPGGRVWLGTNRGLFRYGDFPGEIRYDLYPDVFLQGVNDISSLADGKLLVRTRNGGALWVYDPEENTACGFDEYMSGWGLDASAGWDMKVFPDPEGGIWISGSGRLYRKDPGEEKVRLLADVHAPIRKYDSDGNRFCVLTDSLLYLFSVNRPGEGLSVRHGIKANGTGMSVALDEEGNVWVGSDGLYRFRGEDLRKETILETLPVMDILRSRSGGILAATGISGIYSFSADGKMRQHLMHRSFESGSLSSNNIRSIREGEDGALWVCYAKPLVSVCLPGSMESPSRHILPLVHSGLEENVISIAQAPDGTVWFGTDGQGIFCLDPDTQEFRVPEITLSHPSVTSLFFDSRGRAWIGTYMGGLYCRDGKKVCHFLPNTSCFSILEDRSGNIWAGMSGQGVYWIPGDLDGDPEPVDMLSKRWVYQLSEGKDAIYAATTGGLVSIRPDTREASLLTGTRSGRQAFSNRYFASIVRDSRGLFWTAGIRSDCPLEVFDPIRDTILRIPGLEKQNIKSIVEDRDRNLWLAAEKNLIQVIVNYDSDRGRYTFHPSIYRLRNAEPFTGSYNGRVAVRLSDGTLLFGGTAGYQRIPPTAFPPSASLPKAPALSVTAVQVNNGYRWIDDTTREKGLRLGHQDSDVSVIISAEDYASPFVTTLLYRLRNKESAWKPVRGNVIDLNRLSPGHYDLEVGNGNPDGSLSGSVLPFSIDILAPWYATGWAYFLYALLLVSAVALFVYYYTDRQRKQISLDQIRQEAERQHQLNEMKLRFFTNISHDFRTPLSLIITPLEAYLDDEAHKGEEPFLRPIYRNAVRLLNLVNQILDFRKLEADNVRLDYSYGNLVPFLKDICSSFTQFAHETGRRLSFVADEKEILTAFDKDKLSKILMNLLSNAFKFSPENGTVTVRVSRSGDRFVLSVEDNGPGIPDSRKEEVFERFYQYRGGDSTSIGSGIGLHIVREFVRMQGGTVSVSDNHPSGSVFTVSLPLRGKDEVTSGEPEEGEPDIPGPDIGPVSSGKRLLLVEDNEDFRDFLKGQLSDEFQVYTASDGKEGLQVLEQVDVDVIISDIMMEGMDGLELCKAVKTNLATSHIPFILLTAKALADDEIRGLKVGADEYITKPFHMQILRLRIRKLLEAHLQSQRRFSEKLDVSPSEITITPLDKQFMEKAIRLTEENMTDEDFSVEKLSSLLGMHRAHLYKKLMSLTGKTPLEFIRIIRLKRGAQYLIKSQLYISEIAYRVGYNSPKLFSRHFRSEFGMTPREYQTQNGITFSPEEEDADENEKS